MNDLACTGTTIKNAIDLHCAGPSAPFWHDPVTAALVGALIGALAVIIGQVLAARMQAKAQARQIDADKNLKKMDYDRADAGVRRQIEALVDQVGNFVYIARTMAPVDWVKMGAFVERLQSRIYLWEVSTALTNEQAEGLYFAAGTIEIAYRHALMQPYGDLTHVPENREQEIADCKELFNDASGALATFWETLGDVKRAEYFRKVYEPPP